MKLVPTLVAIAALVVGTLALVPGSTDALIRCFCPPPSEEVTAGSGLSSSPVADCEANARAAAQSYCSSTYGTNVCAWGDFEITSRAVTGSGFIYSCRQEFSCQQCIDLP